MALDSSVFAQELLKAFEIGSTIAVPPSASFAAFDLNAAYAVENEFARLRAEGGHKTTGVKVGYANKAVWRVMKLETLVWAHMYDDTVHYASGNEANLALPYYRAPKLEPEIVFKLKQPITSAALDAATALSAVEWFAVGFEIISCPFPDWQFKPVDFVAAYGLHQALVIGEPQTVEAGAIPALTDALAAFKVRISKNGEFLEEGAGKNSLRSPALCLAELGGAMLQRNMALNAGDLISSGTLTAGHLIAKGETWKVDVDGLALPPLTLQLS